ncbi:gamma-glutamyl-gamma-aminobutyrate hydrolase family protein [Streptosporangium carneum]|uniref:Glutamine amidotransferase n=1 Tax=Streptosporangium carneum TaxID=47481 RepID=A0A9W6HXS9_9ACTN|nr:gamma-glutamyl-gamma-aminobutyrate hydrolase family protein [Streptosporangium carneum]GLK07998.1 glutamine amidotransferase [Streptosporangium carneum]
MSRPVIGVTCYVEPARFTVWETTAALLPYAYVDHVARVGGQPVILPPVGDPAAALGRLDGLILAGGGDVDPARYGQAPHERTGHVRQARDDAEFGLVRAALEQGVPFLGVCRGLQVLNVALGGSLHQHLPDVVVRGDHAPAPGRFGRMPVRAAPGSLTAEILGPGPVEVAHYHHQAVDKVGAGLTVTAHAADGTIEAVELEGHPFALAVQWHPEADDECALFEALVRHVRRARP